MAQAQKQINLVVHDTRLKGWVSDDFSMGLQKIVVDNENQSFQSIIDAIRIVISQNGGGPLNRLSFLSHGDPGIAYVGQGIDRSNANLFGQVKDQMKEIVFYGCALAAQDGFLVDNNGEALCKEIARYSNAKVIASHFVQDYHQRFIPNHAIEFGDWEGDICTFYPPGHRWNSCTITN